jgi:hypothetical protein
VLFHALHNGLLDFLLSLTKLEVKVRIFLGRSAEDFPDLLLTIGISFAVASQAAFLLGYFAHGRDLAQIAPAFQLDDHGIAWNERVFGIPGETLPPVALELDFNQF